MWVGVWVSSTKPSHVQYQMHVPDRATPYFGTCVRHGKLTVLHPICLLVQLFS